MTNICMYMHCRVKQNDEGYQRYFSLLTLLASSNVAKAANAQFLYSKNGNHHNNITGVYGVAHPSYLSMTELLSPVPRSLLVVCNKNKWAWVQGSTLQWYSFYLISFSRPMFELKLELNLLVRILLVDNLIGS